MLIYGQLSIAAALLAALWMLPRLLALLKRVRSLSFLPGPPILSHVWGNVKDIRKAPVGTRYNAYRKTYGPLYCLREPLMEPVLVMGDPKGAQYVLNNTDVFWRSTVDREILGLWFGLSILSTEINTHAQRSRRLSPAFTKQSVKKVSPIVFDLVHNLASEWNDRMGPDESIVVNLVEDLHHLSLNAIARTMFAHDLSDPTGRIPTLLNNFSAQSGDGGMLESVAELVIGAFPRLMNLPNPMKKWADTLRRELGAVAKAVWESVERGESLGGLDARVLEVLSQESKQGEQVTRDDAVAEIIAILFAGSESTGNVMGELLYELARHPHIQTKMRDELRAFKARNGSAPTFDDLMASGGRGLDYFNAVIQETLRLKAVLMDIAREAVADDVIPLENPLPGPNGLALRVCKGQVISIPVRDGLNVDPDIWGEDAEEFRPERWLDGSVGEHGGVGPGGIITFGDGAKACLGRVFAIAELKIVVSTLARDFTFHPSEDHPNIDFYHLGGNTVKPKVRGREQEGVQLPLRIRRA